MAGRFKPQRKGNSVSVLFKTQNEEALTWDGPGTEKTWHPSAMMVMGEGVTPWREYGPRGNSSTVQFAIKEGFWPQGAVLVIVAGLLAITPQNSSAQSTNEWTKPTSGYWEEPYWSLGHLPSMQDDGVLFANDGYKALAIGPSTTANYPTSLSIKNLSVYGGNNLLLSNYSGMNVPLRVDSDFVLGPNASLLSYYASPVWRSGERARPRAHTERAPAFGTQIPSIAALSRKNPLHRYII